MRWFIISVALLGALASACASDHARANVALRLIEPEEAGAGARHVTASDYHFATDDGVLQAGTNEFVVTNAGTEPHEFVIVPVHGVRFGLPAGEIEAFAPGEKRAISIDLPAGDYAFVCLIIAARDGEPQSHMALGMRHDVRVEKP